MARNPLPAPAARRLSAFASSPRSSRDQHRFRHPEDRHEYRHPPLLLADTSRRLKIIHRRARIQVVAVSKVAHLTAVIRTTRITIMVITISNLSSISNSSKKIQRRWSAVRVSVKSVSVIARETVYTGSHATTRGRPRDQADQRETVMTSVTSGANRMPVRRRRNT